MGVLAAAQYLNDEWGHASAHKRAHTSGSRLDLYMQSIHKHQAPLNKPSMHFSITTFTYQITLKNGRDHVAHIDRLHI